MHRCLSTILPIFVALPVVGGLFGADFHQPEPPTELSATSTASSIVLGWVATPSDHVAGYDIYRSRVSTTADPAVRITDELVQGTAFTDNDVSRGVFFCYTVRAVSHEEFQSLDSNEACASFQPNAFGFFKRGDTDGSGSLDISDPIYALSHLFLGNFQPECLDAADFDDNGTIELSDAIASLTFQFLGTEPPPAPGIDSCGFDPTPDGDVELGCNFHICEDEGT